MKRLDQIVNTGRLVPLIVLFLSLCMIDNVSAAARSDGMRVKLLNNDDSTRVSAFLVDHGTVKPAFGYRVDSAGHSVVISGDTKFCQNLVDFARGARCLECWLEKPHAAVEAFNCVCRRCGTGLRDCEAEAWCRLSLQG
jgi:hypothetical protein